MTREEQLIKALKEVDSELASTQLPCDCDDGVSECYCLSYPTHIQIEKAREIIKQTLSN